MSYWELHKEESSPEPPGGGWGQRRCSPWWSSPTYTEGHFRASITALSALLCMVRTAQVITMATLSALLCVVRTAQVITMATFSALLCVVRTAQIINWTKHRHSKFYFHITRETNLVCLVMQLKNGFTGCSYHCRGMQRSGKVPCSGRSTLVREDSCNWIYLESDELALIFVHVCMS